MSQLLDSTSQLVSFPYLEPTNVTTDSRGQVLVLESRTGISVYDSTGRYIKTIGRKGNGPGEFQHVESVAFGSPNMLSVFDVLRRVIISMDHDGAFLQEKPVFRLNGRPDGGLWRGGDTVLLTTSRPVEGGLLQELQMLTAKDTAVLASTLQPLRQAMVDLGCIRVGGLPIVFSPKMLVTVGPNSLAVVRDGGYVIDIFVGGRLARQVKRIVPRQRASVDMASVLPDRSYSVYLDRTAGPSCQVSARKLAEQVGVADSLPSIEAVLIDHIGNLWVERYTSEQRFKQLDVFGPFGRYLGSLVAPGRVMGFPTMKTILVAVNDTLDESTHLVIFRLAR